MTTAVGNVCECWECSCCDRLPDSAKCRECALRLARATMDCAGSVGYGGRAFVEGCAFQDMAPCESETVGPGWLGWTAEQAHRWHASALLDGFSVEEVTAAGG
jgi:hypothetical protein